MTCIYIIYVYWLVEVSFIFIIVCRIGNLGKLVNSVYCGFSPMNVNIVGCSKISHFNMEFNLVMHYNQFGKHHLLSPAQLLSTWWLVWISFTSHCNSSMNIGVYIALLHNLCFISTFYWCLLTVVKLCSNCQSQK